MVDTASKTGFISQIIGPVLDIEFPNGELPKIYNALVIGSGNSNGFSGFGATWKMCLVRLVVVEVLEHGPRPIAGQIVEHSAPGVTI